MASLVLYLCLSAQDIAELKEHLVRLGDDDIEVREAATAALLPRAGDVWDELHAVAASSDMESAARAAWILGATVPLSVSVERDRWGKPAEYPVEVRNAAESRAIYYFRGFSCEFDLLELFRIPPPRINPIWRGWGRTSTGCELSERDFTGVEPGEFWRVPSSVVRRPWVRIPARIKQEYPKLELHAPLVPGRYLVTACYAFGRDAYVARCQKGCSTHDDPSRPWNRARTSLPSASITVEVPSSR